MSRSIRSIAFFTFIMLLVSVPIFALQISQIEFDLHLAPGSSSSYSFLVRNDEPRTQEITVYLNDWVRDPQSETTDFFPKNGAHWLFPRKFKAGERITVIYRVDPPFSGVTVTGSYATTNPANRGEIAGPNDLSAPERETSSSAVTGPVRITREVTPSPDVAGALRVQLTVEALQDFAGLRIDEVFSAHVTIESLDPAGGQFETASRSDGDWLKVAPQKFTIAQGETQEVTFTVHVPTGVSGAYWGAIMVNGSPRKVKRHGTTVLAVEQFGVKVYVTITGTEVLSGRVTSVRKVSLNPLAFTVTFENTGNVQLHPKGSIEIISRKGKVVRTLAIKKFPVLPGATQTITVKDNSTKPLPPGIYLALAVIDYGGETPVGGRLGFRVK